MPKFGNSRAPRTARTNTFKPREDGRGGRSPQRQNREDAPRGYGREQSTGVKRTPFFEAGSAVRDARPDSGAERGAERGERFERGGARGDRFDGRDRFERGSGAARHSSGDRNDRGYRPNGAGAAGRTSRPYEREMPAGRTDRGRDWKPDQKTSAPTGGRKPRHTAEDRARRSGEFDRPARDYDRPARPARDFDRPARPARDYDRPARPGRDFDRPARDFDRPARPARDFDRPARDFDRPARDFDRPARSARDFDRPARDFDRPARPARDFDRPAREGFGRDRDPQRSDRQSRDRSRDASFEQARGSNPNKKAFFEDKVLERLESVEQADAVIVETFENMDLHPKVLLALESLGAITPFPIQAATIPAAISGQDVLGRGKTGSGKTIAFTVPIVTKLVAGGSQPRKPGKPRALVLAPTRELADQIDRTMRAIAKPVGFYSVCIYGGVPQRKQEQSMSRGADIVVATPGRLEDLMAQGIIDLSDVETLVIDEADHMCDLGFIEGVRRVMRACGDSQKLLFSATLDREVDALVREFLPSPYVYEVPNEEADTANITHRVFVVEPDDRSQVLLRLVQGAGKSLIFTRTKMTAERLAESLTAAGVPAARLHGDLNQNQRNRNLERFTSGQVRVMVATDVAARGIHVDDVKLVIQVDPPEEYKTYLHRAGRTGRGHNHGTVITLIYRSRFRRMEDLLRRADRDGIFSDVRPSSALLEELAGPIAPPPVQDLLDFGDAGAGRGGARGGERGGGSRSREGGKSGNYGGNGRGRWADRPAGTPRPRDKRKG